MEKNDQPTTRAETDAAAMAAAEARGRAAAEVNARFEEHYREIGYLKGALAQVRRDLGAITNELHELTSNYTSHLSVSKALTDQLEKRRDNEMTKKTYVLGVVGAVIALGMLLVAAVALTHGGK